ncbi:hypothetical protein ONR57_12650 [Hoyosella sp. YIM 151337]|uniref:hypothetical protein n=1 Tax=Hoyosella sp. YIM 151337 TaxID=2992742 RepID=UPI0022360F0E|nr:hypothetical protein [Hoyosella sp. YIM 151337]MCW4354150.1 hypothetical protein [Hoyosella sp. YIM 151337]
MECLSADASASRWPISVQLDTIAAMLNFEIHHHPVYQGMEVQYFDDDKHGTGVLVLMNRTDTRKVDVYQQEGLTIDRSGYGIAAGLGDWHVTAIEPAVLEITETGVHADVALYDAAGRRIEIQVDDRNGRRRRRAEFLAPVGSAIEHPTALMLVWMRQFDLVRRTRFRPTVRIDGEAVTLGNLPGSRLHRRHLIKYAADLWIVDVNPAAVNERRAQGPGAARAELHVTPEPPPPAAPSPGAGRWSLSIGDRADVVAGEWSCTTAEGTAVSLVFTVTQGWRPRRLPPLMRVVTTLLPVFRRWPTTYRWEAHLNNGHEIEARWRRTSGGDNTYAKLTS